MSLTIVLPAYNEGRRMRASLERVIAFCEKEFDVWEIIVVDDGSSDDTAAVAAAVAEAVPRVTCLENEVNLGKGQSVRRGVLAATHDAVLFSDVDLSTPIEETLSLLAALDRGADIAIASRRLDPSKEVRRKPLRRLMANVFRKAVKLIALRGIHDTQCGFKMFRRGAAREIFPRQQLDGWAFDVEILFIGRHLGYSIEEVPVNWEESAESRLRFWSPLQMLYDLLRIRVYHLAGRYGRKGARPVPAEGSGASGRGD